MMEEDIRDTDGMFMDRMLTDRTLTDKELIELRDGRTMTAVQLLWAYYEQAEHYLQSRHSGAIDDDTSEVMSRWASVLTKLERDPMECARET